jgi:carbonic anhydrase
MKKSFDKLIQGYSAFREKYTADDNSVMQRLSDHGQAPEAMVVSCCDSRVDPALILQCDPGDLFIARNVANIVPPYEPDGKHHGTSAALEFGVCYLHVKHLIILGHSQCGGINGLLNQDSLTQDDFISNWVSIIKRENNKPISVDDCAKASLKNSHQNCLSFPWIQSRVKNNTLKIHLWFFDIKTGQIFNYNAEKNAYLPLS